MHSTGQNNPLILANNAGSLSEQCCACSAPGGIIQIRNQAQILHAGIFHHMPVRMPHGVCVQALVPDPLAFPRLCRRVDDHAVGLHYPAYASVAYTVSLLPEPLGCPQCSPRPAAVDIQHHLDFLIGRRVALRPIGEALDMYSSRLEVLRPQSLGVPLRHTKSSCHHLGVSTFLQLPDDVSYGLVRQLWLHHPL